MSMPIQRQSESFGYFDHGPRFERDRTSTDLPRGLAGLINGMGPRIQAGMLDTRTAVNTHGMDPESHAYHTELPYGPGPGRIYNPDFREYEPSDEDERRQEAVGEDDDSGYNWGPEPRRASRHPFDRTAGAWQDLIDKDGHSPFEGDDPEDFFTNWLARGREEEQHRPHEAGRFKDWLRDGHTPDHETPWEETDEGWHHPPTGQKIVPSDSTPGHWQLIAPSVGDRGLVKLHDPHPDPHAIMDWQNYAMGGPPPEGHQPKFRDHIFPPNPIPSRQSARRLEGRRVALAPQDPAMAPQMPAGGGFLPAHRVGLPWRDTIIPGTVISLDGDKLGVRWDDGQYTSEHPHEVRLL